MRVKRLVLVGLMIVAACSGSDDEDEERDQQACTTSADCNGYTGRGLLLFKKRSPLCVIATCGGDGYCVATPNSGSVADDIGGDCQRPRCDGDGYVETVSDPNDVGPVSIEECKLKSCEPDSVDGAVVVVTENVSGGVPCRLSSGGDGECRFGSCVIKSVSDDGGLDASND